jgi:hypothetical protein
LVRTPDVVRTIGPWVYVEQHGAGGNGTVWRAAPVGGGSEVALVSGSNEAISANSPPVLASPAGVLIPPPAKATIRRRVGSQISASTPLRAEGAKVPLTSPSVLTLM